MTSRHNTFSVALSREMVPTARIVVYYLQTSPEEMVVDTLNFFVNGTRANPVSCCIHIILSTLKCLSIGTPKTINFPFFPNGKLMFLGVPIYDHMVIRLLCVQIWGSLKIINFTFGANGKFNGFQCPNT